MGKQIVFVMALGWTLLIATLCLISFSDFPQTSVANADKYVHATFHFFFTMLWYFYFAGRKREANPLKLSLGILILSVIYGVAIELAQEFFTTTRQADIKDVLANLTGAILAVLTLMLFRKFSEKRQL